MKNKQRNYLQLLFVFAAFAVMVGAAYLFNSRMLRDHLLNGAQGLLISAEANVRAALSETEITLLNSYSIVEGMLEQGASKQEILDYLIITTDWMRQRDTGLLDFYGLYGFINGEFYDGIGMDPGGDYIPQTRPWYQVAIRSGTNIAYTTPYIDWHTGDTIVTAVRNIFIDGNMVGILAVDINIGWLVEYVGSLALAEDGFGMLLSQNLSFMSFPNENYLGRQLQELGGTYEDLARTLRSGGEVFAHRINDPDRGPVIVFINQIFNNWHVGLVTPYSQFYQDLQSSAQIMVLLGFLLSLALCFVLIRLSTEKQRSDEESKAKSSFLARMSHEIRTPLNAVIGLSEIIINRGGLPSDSKNDVQQIHQSGTSLLGIINDILDISKIEAGGFELFPEVYETASFINDTININRVRIGSKPIEFVLDIKGDFPLKLLGDELRVKQVLNNILSNAIKYTKDGTVKLKISHEVLTNSKVKIYIIVSDTGMGIRPEDIGKLFSEYSQLDMQSNRKIEGTGLGLAITKKLVEMMSGSISAESEYGKGSVFSVNLVQEFVGSEIIGEDNAERLKQFQYYSAGKEKEIDRSWMPYGRVMVVDDLRVNLLVANGLLEPYGLKVDTAETGQEAVDMIRSGKKYDLIFMDHMMPGMDGIETVRIIRAWEQENKKKKLPIVALTANALTGNMEIFLSKGFDGFIPKPIDIFQLDDTLNQWVRDKQSLETLQKAEKEKKMNNEKSVTGDKPNSSFPSIHGVDTEKGIAMTGNTEASYIAVLTMFCKDAEDRLSFFQNLPDSNNMVPFVTQVHALKSASGSIGAADLSSLAAELEGAGKAEDIELIKEKLPAFVEQLTKMAKDIKTAVNKYEESGKKNASSASSTTSISNYLHELEKAIDSQKAGEINRILKEIKDISGSLDSASKEALEKISDEVMMVEYDNAKVILNKLMTDKYES